MLKISEEASGVDLTDESVEDDIYYSCLNTLGWNGKPVMEEDCYLNDPEVIANIGLRYLGIGDKVIKQVGTDKGYFSKKYTGYDFIVYKYKTPNGFHFVLGNYNPDPRAKLEQKVGEIYYKEI